MIRETVILLGIFVLLQSSKFYFIETTIEVFKGNKYKILCYLIIYFGMLAINK